MENEKETDMEGDKEGAEKTSVEEGLISSPVDFGQQSPLLPG